MLKSLPADINCNLLGLSPHPEIYLHKSAKVHGTSWNMNWQTTRSGGSSLVFYRRISLALTSRAVAGPHRPLLSLMERLSGCLKSPRSCCDGAEMKILNGHRPWPWRRIQGPAIPLLRSRQQPKQRFALSFSVHRVCSLIGSTHKKHTPLKLTPAVHSNRDPISPYPTNLSLSNINSFIFFLHIFKIF